METAPAAPRVARGAAIAEFMERRGRRVVQGCGVFWHSVDWRFYMSVPYDLPLNPDPSELEQMLRSHAAMGARFPSTRLPGLSGGVYICRQRGYRLEGVHAKHRPRVKHGLERYRIRPVERDELLYQGLQLNHDTLVRQHRNDPEFSEPGKWRRVVEAICQSPAVEAVGAFAGERLASYMITCRDGRCLHILHQMSRQDELPEFPNHVLTFQVTKDAMADPNLDSVCYGSMSLVSIEGLHEYKLRFGYEVIPFNCAFQLHPAVNRLMTSAPVLALVRGGRLLAPSDQRLERVETVLNGARISREENGVTSIDSLWPGQNASGVGRRWPQ